MLEFPALGMLWGLGLSRAEGQELGIQADLLGSC